jgi:hypothetical protein
MEQERLNIGAMQMGALYGLAIALHDTCTAGNISEKLGGTAEQEALQGTWTFEPKLGNWQNWRWRPSGWRLDFRMYGGGNMTIVSTRKQLTHWFYSCSHYQGRRHYTVSSQGFSHEGQSREFGGPLPEDAFNTFWTRVHHACQDFVHSHRFTPTGPAYDIFRQS